MKKILVTAIVVAAAFYFGNRFTAVQVQAETEPQAQVQESAVEIFGKIKEANGNEIVVAIGRTPSSERGGMGTGFPGSGGEAPTEDFSARGQRGQMPDMPTDSPQQGERPSNARGDTGSAGDVAQVGSAQTTGSGQMTRGSQTGRASMRGGMTMSSVTLELTGEEETFLIPVTAKITTGSGENERAIRFTQLAYKNIVKLTLNEDGAITAVSVLS